jgi:hypothetical protein
MAVVVSVDQSRIDVPNRIATLLELRGHPLVDACSIVSSDIDGIGLRGKWLERRGWREGEDSAGMTRVYKAVVNGLHAALLLICISLSANHNNNHNHNHNHNECSGSSTYCSNMRQC